MTDDDIGTKNYRRLLAVVAEHLSLDESKFLQEQRLDHEGIILRFEHLAHTNLCRIGMELSPMPESAEAFKAMLESNAYPEEGLLSVLAFDRVSGHPMVFFHFPAVGEAEQSLRCFLDFGMYVFLGHWQEMWEEQLTQEAASVSMLA